MSNDDYAAEMKGQEEVQKQIESIKALARQHMTREAISRLGNVEAAHPELALRASMFVAKAVQMGSIKEKITDEQLKQILKQIQDTKRDTKIRRI